MRVSRGLAAAVVIGCLAFGASGRAAPKEPPRSPPLWLAEPDGAAADAVWPEAARRQGVGGRAIMRCQVDAEGALKDCRLVAETPSASGFGQALLSLAPLYRRNLADYPGDEATIVLDWFEADTPPDWVKRPTARDIMAVYPGEAMRKGTGGQAVVSCIATPQGSLSDCVPIWEKPAGAGFGAAAVALTAQFAMRPATRQGRPVPSTVRIPINFKTFGPTPSSEMKRVAPPGLPWAEAPSYADVVAAYPAKARAEKLAGRAVLACEMTQEGRLRDCATHSEAPKGRGFAPAAKTLAKTFRIEIASAEDRKATKQIVVHLPFVFDPAMLSESTPVVGRPSWAGLPGADEMLAVVTGLKLTAPAKVMLSCVVQPGGGLDSCRVVSEDPAGLGVGAAALGLTPKFRMTTWTAEGLPTVGGSIRIPIRFEP